jgi:16S rRNA (guanine966-N2)-methyltransferase
MRIISGTAKGCALKVPREVARPTTDRVRESLFGILQTVIGDSRVLDLFAGSGALGMEALSRGAMSCTFVDQNRGAVRAIEGNLKKTGLTGGNVVLREVLAYLKGERATYDLIFADPPYADGVSDLAADLIALEGWERWLSEDGFLVVEREAAGELPVCDLELVQQRDYGRSRIAIYRRKP